jgi:signal transduction histidine kinase
MTISLRTRLSLAVAVILAVAVGLSAVLSRSATLFEVRSAADAAAGEERLEAPVAAVRAALERDGARAAVEALEEFRRRTRRGFLLADDGGRVIVTSNPGFTEAVVSAPHDEARGGPLGLTLPDDARITLPAVPAFRVRIDGEAARLFVLANPGQRRPPAVPPWLQAAAVTGLLALVLIFGLARRILRPIGALTQATRQMEAGDLDVRVDAHGSDEIAELARAFNSMAAKLAETERLRRQLVGDVAHELRSPVTNLRCMLEGLQDGLERPDAGTIAALYDETMFLQRLISDLQELTLAEAGSLLLQRQSVDVAEIVARAVATLQAVPDRAAIQVEVNGPLWATADPDRLEQVLRNLLANALQHTPAEGRVEVRATALGETLEITVRDTGVGIAPEHLPYVFDRFYRADASRSRRTGGAGLGLAIVKQLVTAHGGVVTAASDGPGRGATFRLTLPAAAAPPARVTPAASTDPGPYQHAPSTAG